MPTVSLICLTDRPLHLQHFLAMLALQTYQHWDLTVLDQGGNSCAHFYEDARIRWTAVPDRRDWGQTEKMSAVAKVTGEYVGFPNDDGYYCPAYLTQMVAAGQARAADLVYCDWVSAHDMGRDGYVPYQGAPVIGYLDVGGFLVRREVMLRHGWPDRGPTGDGVLIESLVKSGITHVRVPKTLYVKN